MPAERAARADAMARAVSAGARGVLRGLQSGSAPAALNAAADARVPVRFVTHDALPRDEAYESFVHRTASVPTRNDLHDVFNGVMWLSHPQTKQRLNALHAAAIEARGVAGSRGPLRDALTLFDENAALLQAPSTLVEALRDRRWRAAFIEHRPLWQHARVQLFGHALLEKLLEPRKAITAHAWVVADLDERAVAASLDPERLAAKDFLPLPVLGVPGWCAANEAAAFYEDEAVFRPKRD